MNGFESVGLAFNSQVINAFSPNQWRGLSDFDTTHQLNANWVWDMPYGRGRHWGSSAHGLMNGIFGGWGFNGLLRWTSGFPFTVPAGAGWATDFELEGSSVLVGPKPKTGVFFDSSGNPTVFKDPQHTITCACSPGTAAGAIFRPTYPGESGQRNNFRGPGYFDVDFSIVKKFGLPNTRFWGEGANIELRGNSFNTFNKLNLQPFSFGTDNTRVENLIFGRSPGALAGRVLEFQAKFNF